MNDGSQSAPLAGGLIELKGKYKHLASDFMGRAIHLYFQTTICREKCYIERPYVKDASTSRQECYLHPHLQLPFHFLFDDGLRPV